MSEDIGDSGLNETVEVSQGKILGPKTEEEAAASIDKSEGKETVSTSTREIAESMASNPDEVEGIRKKLEEESKKLLEKLNLQ